MIDELNNQITCHKCDSKNIYISEAGNVDDNFVNEFFGEPAWFYPFEFGAYGYFNYEWCFTCDDCGVKEILDVNVSNLGGQKIFDDREPISQIEVDYSENLKEPLSFFWLQNHREFEIIKTHKFFRLKKHIPVGLKLSDYPFGVYQVETRDGYCCIEALPDEDEDKSLNWHRVKWYLASTDNNFFKKIESGEGGKQPQLNNRKNYLNEISKRRMGISINTSAYELIYKLENELRLLIYNRLSDKYRNDHGDMWWQATVTHDIRKRAEEKSLSEQGNPYMKVKKFHHIFYCDFPDLLEIIRKEWKIFKNDFIFKEIFQGKFKELQFYRNMIAHNRALTYEQLVEINKIINQIYSALGNANIALF